MSLIEEAKKIRVGRNSRKEFDKELVELVLAVLAGEISDNQARQVMDSSHQSLHNRAWPIIKYAYCNGYITINHKK